jgi:acetylornithine/succinyldiaminopimelate/putrescine aminotransferase
VSPSAVRMLPALILTEEDAMKAAGVLEEVLAGFSESARGA